MHAFQNSNLLEIKIVFKDENKKQKPNIYNLQMMIILFESGS